MKPPQCSPSCSACGCHVDRSGSSSDQHGPVQSPIPDGHPFIYNPLAQIDALPDSLTSSSMRTPGNVHCCSTDVTLLDRFPSIDSDVPRFDNTYSAITRSHPRTNYPSEIDDRLRETAEFNSDRTMQHIRGRTKRNIAERRRRMENLDHLQPADGASSLNSSSNNIYGITPPPSFHKITRGHALCRIPRLVAVLKSNHSDDARSLNDSANNSFVIRSTACVPKTFHRHAPSGIPRPVAVYKSNATESALVAATTGFRKSTIPVPVRSHPIRTYSNCRVISALATRVGRKTFTGNARAAVFSRYFSGTPSYYKACTRMRREVS